MEEKVQEKVQISGRYDPYYALVINHEGYAPAVAAQVQVQIGDKDIKYTYAINKKGRDAIEFAIRRLKQPFFVIPIPNDLVSNSGEHSVQFSSDSFLSRELPRGLYELIPKLYVLEKELTFPKPRPKIDDLEKLKKDFHREHREYIAWAVSKDQVHKLWILKYIELTPDYIELTIPEDEDFEFKRLQGNLYYAPVELLDEETEYSLPWRTRFKIFNHKLDSVYALSFVYNDGICAIVHAPTDTSIHSEDHETVTLKGTYLLYHPFPRDID